MVAEELTLSPDVDMISFTGSTAVGRRIMEKGASTLKRVFLELGGKSAARSIRDDADFQAAVPMGSAFTCMHAGQGCSMRRPASCCPGLATRRASSWLWPE